MGNLTAKDRQFGWFVVLTLHILPAGVDWMTDKLEYAHTIRSIRVLECDDHDNAISATRQDEN